MKSPLAAIGDFGQSIWLDYIRRGFLLNGDLKALIDNDGLKGVTSNPAIFEEAIAHSDDYWDTIQNMASEAMSTEDVFLTLAMEDVRTAADIFKEVYASTNHLDGYVSLEVSPSLAMNTEGTITEAKSSWKTLDRPNVMIKIPATLEGIPAIKAAISEGININVTLLFSLERYRVVAENYIGGIEERLAKGLPVKDVYSVASFFLSRIDTLVDPMLEKAAAEGGDKGEAAKSLIGEIAIASAKGAYNIYKELFHSDRFKALAEKGANPQRLLWASTSTKNKAYSDVKYIEALIGPDTVNTVPQETLKAYRDHGNPASRLEDGAQESKEKLARLEKAGISLNDVTRTLEEEAISKFVKPFQSLMGVLAEKLKEAADVSHS